MSRPIIPHGATDSVLGKLAEAIATPDRITRVSAETSMILRRVSNPAHREFLGGKLHEIEAFQKSPRDLTRISHEIDAWSDREFPVQRK